MPLGDIAIQVLLFSEIHGENETKRKLLSGNSRRELRGEGNETIVSVWDKRDAKKIRKLERDR
jgi:hypothetical protein